MSTLIQLKRSLTTALPASLANGEAAYTANGDVLYIGSNGAVVAIGGKRVPGVLTANQALVSNSSAWMDSLQSAKLIIGAVGTTINIQSINTTANSTVLGAASNTELVTSWAIKSYVDSKTASASPGGANTYIQFNDSGTLNGVAGMTFDKTTNNFTISNTVIAGVFSSGNSTVNAVINSVAMSLNGGAVVVNNSQVSVGANVSISTTTFAAGNSTANLLANSILVKVSNASGTANLQPTQLVIGSSTVNATSVSTVDVTGSGNATFSNINASANVNALIISARDMTLTGNLTVSGTMTSVDTTNLQTKDSMFKMADQQATADALSIGFYGEFGNSTVTQFGGLFRDQSDSGYWKLFTSQKEPTTTVDTANNTYAVAGLKSWLSSGGPSFGAFVANNTVVNITANSTVAVAIAANSLSLTTALPVTSGGTGLSAVSAGDILVGNSSNLISRLSVGSDGNLLQVSGSSVVWGNLDGGSY